MVREVTMYAIADGGALVLGPAQRKEPVEVRPAPCEETPALFERLVRKRSHDGIALGVAVLLVSALIGLGVWMTIEIAEGLAIAEYCDGKCTEVVR
jgi:hypothetical protein